MIANNTYDLSVGDKQFTIKRTGRKFAIKLTLPNGIVYSFTTKHNTLEDAIDHAKLTAQEYDTIMISTV